MNWGQFAAFFVVGLTPLASWLATGWVRSDDMPNEPHAAIVALSTGMTASSVLRYTGADRLLTAIELMQGGAVSVLVTTRVAVKLNGAYPLIATRSA